MNTNINSDNYEAYLLDYMEGRLSSDETAKLQAYVAAQGLDWEELTEPLPYLEAPQIAYPEKSKLRSLSPWSLSLVEASKGSPKSRSLSSSKGRPQSIHLPLYAKIASAAAAAGLLLTIGLWPDKSMSQIEHIAELNPIEAHLTIGETPMRLVPKRTVQMAATPSLQTDDEISREHQVLAQNLDATNKPERVETLSPLTAQSIASTEDPETILASDLDLLRYRMETGQALEQLVYEPSFEEEMPTSFIGRAIYRWSQGRYSSVNDVVNAGLTHSKQEIADITTEIAMDMQQRTEEYFADAKEYWKSKREE